MKSAALIALGLACASAHAAVESEALRMYFSRTFLQHLVDMPVENNRSISQTVMGTVVKGTAITKGQLSLELSPAANNAVLMIRIDADTDSHSVGKNVPRKDITVHIYSTAKTKMVAEKAIIVYPDHLETRDAICSARTELTYGNLQIDATGLFKNIKEREAHKQAAAKLIQAKPKTEQEASETAKKEMCKLLDDRITPNLFRSLNVAFKRDFYRPLFGSGRIPADLHFMTVPAYIGMHLDEQGGLPAGALETRPEFTPRAPMGVRIHESLLTATLAKRLAGRAMNEEDLEEFFIMHGLNARLAKYKATDVQAQFMFDPTTPIAVRFRDGGMDLSLHAPAVRMGDKLMSGFSMTGRYGLVATPEGDLKIERFSVETTGGSPELKTRITRLFPEGMSISKFNVPEKLDVKGELRVKKAQSKDGWLVLEWELVK